MSGVNVQVVGDTAVIDQQGGSGRIIMDSERVLIMEDRASAPGTAMWQMPRSFAAAAAAMLTAGVAALPAGDAPPVT